MTLLWGRKYLEDATTMTPLDPIYEILAKEVINGFDKPEFSVVSNAFLAVSGYKIDQVFNDPTTGFQALGLTSLTPEKPPVLIFRAADEQIDDIANADPRGIGSNQFLANREAIATWLAKFSGATLKPDLVGHSMGGAIAQLTAADLTDQFGNLVTFNAPGINNSTVTQFQQKGISKNITHYIVNGDLVSLGGQGYLPGSVVLQTYTDGTIVDPIFALDKHIQLAAGRRLLSTPPPGYTQTDITVQDLSSAGFNFNQETDFKEFIAAYQATPNNVASALTSRGSFEALRVSPGTSFLSLILAARAVVALDQPNVLVGDERDNIVNGRQGNDRILGNGGNDQLQGGADNDRIFGGIGDDLLSGNGGRDQLTGDEGNDILGGSGGRDRLTGVNAQAIIPGQGERDQLRGGGDQDVFVLGDSNQAYYDDGKRKDFALILDLQAIDKIQLNGTRSDYRLQAINLGTGIFITQGAQPELIGVVQNGANLTLNSDQFRFV
jgi:serralysin